MLSSQEITDGLQKTVNDNPMLAIFWHAVIYAAIIAWFTTWQPSNRLLALSMCLPVLSVAILAWLSGNPFNGTTFLILSAFILIIGLRISLKPAALSEPVFVIAGILMVVFGLIYPHFTGQTVVRHLYASPLGLIPCPTLSFLIGLILIFNGLGSKAIQLTLIGYGLFYGIFGILKLAVYVDLFLISGTLALLGKYIITLKN